MTIRTILKFLYLPVFLFLNYSVLYGSQRDSLIVDAFYRNLYDYNFHSADSILRNINGQKISPEIKGLLQISYSWWLIISGENDPELVNGLNHKIDSEISRIENETPEIIPDQNKILQLIFLYSYKSRLHNFRNNRLASFSAFKQSYNYFEKLSPCTTGYCEMHNFITGMYYALGGHLQEQFAPVFLLGMNKNFADKEKGYALLIQCTTSANKQIRTESIYFLMKLYLEVQEDPKSAYRYSEMLVDQFPANLVFRYNQVLTLHALGNYTAADSAYNALVELSENAIQLSARQKQHFRKEYERLHP